MKTHIKGSEITWSPFSGWHYWDGDGTVVIESWEVEEYFPEVWAYYQPIIKGAGR